MLGERHHAALFGARAAGGEATTAVCDCQVSIWVALRLATPRCPFVAAYADGCRKCVAVQTCGQMTSRGGSRRQRAVEASRRCHSSLVQALKRIITVLAPAEPELVMMILRPLPAVELARLARVNKCFFVALTSLRQRHPGERYGRPSASDVKRFEGCSSRLVRAGAFGDVAVIRSMVAAGRDEYGSPLIPAASPRLA